MTNCWANKQQISCLEITLCCFQVWLSLLTKLKLFRWGHQVREVTEHHSEEMRNCHSDFCCSLTSTFHHDRGSSLLPVGEILIEYASVDLFGVDIHHTFLHQSVLLDYLIQTLHSHYQHVHTHAQNVLHLNNIVFKNGCQEPTVTISWKWRPFHCS